MTYSLLPYIIIKVAEVFVEINAVANMMIILDSADIDKKSREQLDFQLLCLKDYIESVSKYLNENSPEIAANIPPWHDSRIRVQKKLNRLNQEV